jgi:hypothetical protein
MPMVREANGGSGDEPIGDEPTGGEPTGDELVIGLLPDELALARSQLASGLAAVAEATLRRHAARLELQGEGAVPVLDAVRALLAEALWRQQRALEAGRVVAAISTESLERQRPLVLLVEAEAKAAAGHVDRATALMEEVLGMVGPDEAWRLRAGVPTRLPWPLPPSMRSTARRGPRAAAAVGARSGEQTAAAHGRLEAARLAYGAGDLARGDRELGIAVRLDPQLAEAGMAILEPTLGEEPGATRLLLYGDLLRATGHGDEASAVYDRAARAAY